MGKGNNVEVTKESSTGRNQKFLDKKTGVDMTRAEFVKEIEKGNYPDYHVRKINNKKTPVSNPNGGTGDNLD